MLAATHKSRPALSLVEVLVVIGIMGLLVGLTLSAIQAARGSAARVGCANNLRQLGLAATSYHDAHGALPQPYVTMWKFPGHDAILPWTNLLLPYLEQEALWRTLYAAYQTDAGYVNPPHVGLTTVVKVYTCPADGRLSAPIADDWGFTAAYSSYLGVVDTPSRPTAMAHFGGVRFTDVTDGTNQSLLVGERPPPGRALSGNWYTNYLPDPSFPIRTGLHHGTGLSVRYEHDSGRCRGPFQFGPGRIENPCDSYHFWSLHSGGANFLFVDGSVHFLRYSAADILPALSTRAGGESAAVPE